jgi:hypothetical protein
MFLYFKSLAVILNFLNKPTDDVFKYVKLKEYASSLNESIHLAFVTCGKAHIAHEAMVPIKSAVLLSHSNLVFHLVVENETRSAFHEIVSVVMIITTGKNKGC